MKKKPKPIDESSLPPGLRSDKVGDRVTIFDKGVERSGVVTKVNDKTGAIDVKFDNQK